MNLALTRFCHGIQDLFFERMECPVCRGESKGLCVPCQRQMEKWGSFTLGDLKGQAMFHYSGAVQSLIHAYKMRRSFEARRGLETVMADWLAGHELVSVDVIVPVTSIKANLRKRGFDPALLLARSLAIRPGIPLVNCIQNKGTRETKAMDYRERKDQAGSRLEIHPSGKALLKGKRVLIFDDILTTGSTMEAAAKLIRDAGADHVEFLVIARSTG